MALADLFGKKKNLSKEQIDQIDSKVELTKAKYSNERKIKTDLLKPVKQFTQQPIVKQLMGPTTTSASKPIPEVFQKSSITKSVEPVKKVITKPVIKKVKKRVIRKSKI